MVPSENLWETRDTSKVLPYLAGQLEISDAFVSRCAESAIDSINVFLAAAEYFSHQGLTEFQSRCLE